MRVGVIGCGYWGPNLIRNFVEIEDCALIAVADLDQAQLARVKARYPQTHTTTDYRDLLESDLDAIVLSTPPETHYSLAAECLSSGHHVLVEKPLTTSSADATALVALAEEHERLLMVGHTFEYNPAVRALRDLMQSGELGSIHYIDAVRVGLGLYHSSLNVIWDLAPHDISIMMYLLGERPTSVTARGMACLQDGIEDVAYLSLQFPSRVATFVRLSWLDPRKTRRITVVGSKKMAVYDDMKSEEKIKLYDKSVSAFPQSASFPEFQFDYHHGSVTSPHIPFEEPLRVECRHFIDSIRHNSRPQTDGSNGLTVVEVIEAAQQSLRSQGRAVPIGLAAASVGL